MVRKKVVRRYLVTSKAVRLVIKTIATNMNLTISAITQNLIDIGLRYEEEAHRRKINAAIFQRPPNIKYVVSRSEKTYLSVPDNVYQKVKAYAQKRDLKLIEASWRLIAIGLQYDFGGDPKLNPAFLHLKEIQQIIKDNIRKKKSNIAEEYLIDPEIWAIDKADEIDYTRRQRLTQQRREGLLSKINILEKQKKLREDLLVGMFKKMQALSVENDELKQKLKSQAVLTPQIKNNPGKETDFPLLD
jgi:hypothetical protein